MTAHSETPTDRQMEEAIQWFYRIAEAPGDRTLQSDLSDWLATDARHAKAWDLAQRSWEMSGAGADAARPVEAAKPPDLRRRGIAALSGLALAAGLALFFAMPELNTRLKADHRTATAQMQTVTLEDGSRVHLSADSAISTQFSAERRDMTLLRGRAFFEVAKNPDRPFVVDADGMSVTVTGTAFDVAFTDRTFTVAVAEGGVRVGTPISPTIDLVKGDRLAIDRPSGTAERTRIDVHDVAAWRGGTLIVRDQPFADVVDAIRRHSKSMIFVAMDDANSRRVTGVYDLNNPERALKALAGPFGGVVRAAGPYLISVTAF